MSVQVFGTARLSSIASNLYRDFSEYIFTFNERQLAEQQSNHERKIFHDEPGKARDDLSILLDHYRWFFERIHLANQLQSLKRYTSYDKQDNITHEQINVLASTDKLNHRDLLTSLQLIHYNCDEFLNNEDEQKLLRFTRIVSDRIIQLCEIKN